MIKEVPGKSKESERFKDETAINFLLRTKQNEIFYRDGITYYVIPIQYELGCRTAPFRVN